MWYIWWYMWHVAHPSNFMGIQTSLESLVYEIYPRVGWPSAESDGTVLMIVITVMSAPFKNAKLRKRVACNVALLAWALVRCFLLCETTLNSIATLFKHQLSEPLQKVLVHSLRGNLGFYYWSCFHSNGAFCSWKKVYPDSSHGQIFCRSNTLKDVPMEIGGPSSGGKTDKTHGIFSISDTWAENHRENPSDFNSSTEKSSVRLGDLGWEVPKFIQVQ